MAVTYYNQTVIGGTPAKRYPDPLVTGKANGDGLYPWSVFRAFFAEIVDNRVLPFGAPISYPEFLLFTSDVLAVGYVQDVGNNSNEGYVTPSLAVSFFQEKAGGAPVVSPAGKVGDGYVATGSAAPDDYIRATGFTATVPFPAITFDSAYLVIYTNSANISSPISMSNWATVVIATADASGALPIIIPYTQYTTAIRDAGNVFVATAGPAAGAAYQVVGLCDPNP
jgi:hypothetical protein